jgi:rfaE bifunctional protein kinase chain/domain
MNPNSLSLQRVERVLAAAAKSHISVIGDVMLDQFLWGSVARISPEAPVPVVDFERESFMPGGAANVARNLTALSGRTELFGVTRIVAHKQQVVRIDRETRDGIAPELTRRLLGSVAAALSSSSAVIVGDYGKGVITQALLEELKRICRNYGIWLSLDPKPVHHLSLTGLSLITPNRKETFELANLPDDTRNAVPLADRNLMRAAEKLLNELRPALLLITLGESGMLLCQRDQKPIHIPTVAKEVFDVSGAGDTVIAAFTLAIAGGASPLEAAILSNHAAGIVVGKIGTATVSPQELLASFKP